MGLARRAPRAHACCLKERPAPPPARVPLAVTPPDGVNSAAAPRRGAARRPSCKRAPAAPPMGLSRRPPAPAPNRPAPLRLTRPAPACSSCLRAGGRAPAGHGERRHPFFSDTLQVWHPGVRARWAALIPGRPHRQRGAPPAGTARRGRRRCVPYRPGPPAPGVPTGRAGARRPFWGAAPGVRGPLPSFEPGADPLLFFVARPPMLARPSPSFGARHGVCVTRMRPPPYHRSRRTQPVGWRRCAAARAAASPWLALCPRHLGGRAASAGAPRARQAARQSLLLAPAAPAPATGPRAPAPYAAERARPPSRCLTPQILPLGRAPPQSGAHPRVLGRCCPLPAGRPPSSPQPPPQMRETRVSTRATGGPRIRIRPPREPRTRTRTHMPIPGMPPARRHPPWRLPAHASPPAVGWPPVQHGYPCKLVARPGPTPDGCWIGSAGARPPPPFGSGRRPADYPPRTLPHANSRLCAWLTRAMLDGRRGVGGLLGEGDRALALFASSPHGQAQSPPWQSAYIQRARLPRAGGTGEEEKSTTGKRPATNRGWWRRNRGQSAPQRAGGKRQRKRGQGRAGGALACARGYRQCGRGRRAHARRRRFGVTCGLSARGLAEPGRWLPSLARTGREAAFMGAAHGATARSGPPPPLALSWGRLGARDYRGRPPQPQRAGIMQEDGWAREGAASAGGGRARPLGDRTQLVRPTARRQGTRRQGTGQSVPRPGGRQPSSQGRSGAPRAHVCVSPACSALRRCAQAGERGASHAAACAGRAGMGHAPR
jgi:hypothetical protein